MSASNAYGLNNEQDASFGLSQNRMLSNVRVLEFSAIGPVPWGVGILADMGASITRIVRSKQANLPHNAISERARKDIVLNLKKPQDLEKAKALIQKHDVLVEGMRPGVMERLGLSLEVCLQLNPKLVFARVTGWGQDGPLAKRAGHDINYIALSGALHAIGPAQGAPVIPLNLVGDYGGGGAFLLIGLLSALLHARSTGKGSVVDVAMLDGATKQMGLAYERFALGQWKDQRESNLLDGGCPWYQVYQTKCGGYMAVGAIEPQFYSIFVEALGLDEANLPSRDNQENWPKLKKIFTKIFLQQTRTHWTQVFEPIDACVSPVLSLKEAPLHPHNQARATFFKDDHNHWQPGLAPRFKKVKDA